MHRLRKRRTGPGEAVLARVVPDTKSGTPGADAVKVKGTITWVGAHAPSEGGGVGATVRLFDRLFSAPQPDAGDGDFLNHLNPHSLAVVQAWVEPGLAAAQPSSACSSSATATSSPTARSTPRDGRCSTASPA